MVTGLKLAWGFLMYLRKPERLNPYLWGLTPKTQLSFNTLEVVNLFDLASRQVLFLLIKNKEFPPADVVRSEKGKFSIWSREIIEKEKERREVLLHLLAEIEDKLKSISVENYHA